MSKVNGKGLVPELRFPEFRDTSGWNQTRLAEFNDLVHGDGDWILSKDISTHGQYQIVQLGNIGFGEFIEKPMKTITKEKFTEINGTKIEKGDLLINRMVDSNLYCCIFDKKGSFVTSVDVCWIRENHSINNYFLMNLILNHSSQNNLLSLSSGSGRVRISKKNLFEKFYFFLPGNQEQEKIADCLSSLDELITAHTQKHQTLQSYKKGLMQNLFPAEGRTVPALRFPEFEDAGEWEFKPLAKIAENLDSERVPITSKDRVKGDVPYYGASGIIDYVQGYIFDESLLCISEDGANLVARVYPVAFSISGKTWVNNHAHVLKFQNPCSQVIVENYLNFVSLEGYLTGMAQPKLNRTKLNIIPIPISNKEEQQKIAESLSSVDKLITAQAQKIEALKVHKKGLMQQLFPAISESGV